MKSKAYTLAEILLVIVIIGVLSSLMIANLKTDKQINKTYIAKVMKVINDFEGASAEIMSIDTTRCPMGTFIGNLAGVEEFVLMDESGSNVANATDAVDTFANFIKFQQKGISFCNFTSYCNDANIIGAKYTGDIYVGIEKFEALEDCPEYKLPNMANMAANFPAPKNHITDTVEKCWGKLYIDADGPNGPNTFGNDVFIFGLGKNGIAR